MTNKNRYSHVFLPATCSMPPGTQLWLNSCGRLQSHGGVRFRYGGYCCLHLVESGRGTVRTPTASAALGPGDMFCLLNDCVLDYQDDPDDPWAFSWVHLTGEAAPTLCRRMGFVGDTPWRFNAPRHELQPLFEALRECLGASDCNPYEIVSLLYRLVGFVMPAGGNEAPLTLVEQAEKHMDAMLQEFLNVNALACFLGVSRSTLLNAFRQERDCTPIEMLRQKRVERARRMLVAGEDKIATIARACGFSSEKYFIRTFRQLVGLSPGAYRMKNRIE